MSEACVKAEGGSSTKKCQRPASTGSKDTENRIPCTFRSRSNSVDGKLPFWRNTRQSTGGTANQMATESAGDTVEGNSSCSWSHPKRPQDIGYLLIIKEEIIYRIPILLDVTRIDESKVNKNDRNERNFSIPATNENEICVMMKTCAAKNLEIALKQLFQHCDWVTILAASPLPDQVRRDLATPNVTPKKPPSNKRPRPTPNWTVPPKKSFRPEPQELPMRLNNGHPSEGHSNGNHTEAAPIGPNPILSGVKVTTDRFHSVAPPPSQNLPQPVSSVRQSSLSAIAASAKVDEVLAMQKTLTEKNAVIAENSKNQTQEIAVAQLNHVQTPKIPQQSRIPSAALASSTQVDRTQARNVVPEARNAQCKPLPVFIHTLNRPTAEVTTVAGSLTSVQSRAQRSLFPNEGALMSHLAPLFPLPAVASVACISNHAVHHHRQQQQQAQQTRVGGGNFQFVPQYPVVGSYQDFPMDLSTKVSLPTATMEAVNKPSDLHRQASTCYEEGVVINLAKPKQLQTNDVSVEVPRVDEIRSSESTGKNESRWKCYLCNLDFEMECWLQKHYRSHKHVCKLLESVGGSEALQKRIKCREINSETLVDEKTGKLLLCAINRLINSNSNNSASRLPNV